MDSLIYKEQRSVVILLLQAGTKGHSRVTCLVSLLFAPQRIILLTSDIPKLTRSQIKGGNPYYIEPWHYANYTLTITTLAFRNPQTLYKINKINKGNNKDSLFSN